MSLISGGFGLPLNIVSITTSKIIFEIPKGFNGKSYTFSLVSPLKITKSTTFTQG